VSAPLVVNTADGTVWTRRGSFRNGEALYAPEGVCSCPEFVMATLVELAEHGISGSADVLPVPVGPQLPEFPPPPETELEKLHAERARLQGLLAEAVADAHRARRERDDMRERVSEPYGCAHCGIAERSHGRRWTTGVGYHAWEAPSEGQIAERMKARRTVRLAARAGELGRLRAQVEALLVERHSTNESLSEAAEALRADRDRIAELEGDVRRLNTQRGDVALLIERERGHGEECVDIDDLEAALALGSDEVAGALVEASADRLTRLLAPTQALQLEDPHDSPLAHSYRLGRDLPEPGGAR
jgi:hypothetical protein